MEKKTCEGYMLLIETATSICSVALSFGDELVAFKESNVPNSHSAMLNVLIDELLKENGVSYGDIVAVALSIGPGSYTGLRIGSSTAKGLAYALSVPVITIDTLDILAFAAHETHNGCFVIAMIDARRMEVYAKIFDCDMNVVRGCRADVLCEDFYDEFFSENDRVLLVGDGAGKTKELFKNKSGFFYDDNIRLSSRYMVRLAQEKFLKKDFADTAYFEPFYLKDFVAVHSKVKGLR
ncbi:MAG: tRNA (adenosine(37)-N6)-threonylcarbamoyltransferase complex dimerization subunit type 1 TsaB [Bacteroidales bacterium]|nr:tRNA (adenosine(37)-N6)-threonylcarbamoyltransferase complex dimerization subunit type 1 TsaB [Bacteroidales bacterium]